VTVHELALLDLAGDRLEIQVRCSAGTYVRALARDLGERLAVGAHLVTLRRTRSGPFDLAAALTLEDLAQDATRRLVRMAALLPEIAAVCVPSSALRMLKNGRDLGASDVLAGFPTTVTERVRLVDESGELLALAVPRGFGPTPAGLAQTPVLHPDVVLLD
jgi:tRNA pseudouridine55 synthase